MERWREIDWIFGYKGKLEVSDSGRVRRTGYIGRMSRKPDKVLMPQVESHGYSVLAVYIDGRRFRFLVHRAVARAFVSGYQDGLTVNHINGVKTDNRAINLEWVPLAKNTAMQWETGLVNLRADANPQRKLSSDQVKEVRRLKASGAKVGALASQFGVSISTIYKVCGRLRWASV